MINSYTEDKYLTDGLLDLKKIHPFLLIMPDNPFWSIGAQIGKAWGTGKKVLKSNQ